MFGKLKVISLAVSLAASSAIAANVACVGNSITEGYGIDWGVKKYPDHLQDLMQPGDSVANFGTSGKMFYKESGESYWVQGKIKEALAFPADIVVIELGTNDSKLFYFTYYNVTVDMLKPSYEDLLDTFAHLPTNPEIYATLQPYSNNVEWGIMDTSIVKYNKKLIVMVTNIGGDVNQGQFDIMIPGGGVGQFNGCAGMGWGAQGEQYGGLLSDCEKEHNYNAGKMASCLTEKCNKAFGSDEEAKKGCLFLATWMNAAGNPEHNYVEVECPEVLKKKY